MGGAKGIRTPDLLVANAGQALMCAVAGVAPGAEDDVVSIALGVHMGCTSRTATRRSIPSIRPARSTPLR